MRLAQIPVLANDADEMEISRSQGHLDFLMRFSACTGVGRFAEFGFQFAAARAPLAEVRLLAALHQKHTPGSVETVEQGRDLIRQRHRLELKHLEASLATCAREVL